ncbi:hypothetical protein [Streptomyces sp. NPDC000410]|uniref:hypothetical protein n=1 Tax=Streptomyces sp. NPDC000410 TaxID=3154254 RepID=UPI00332984E8
MLVLTQSAATAVSDPTRNDIVSKLDGLTAHRMEVTDGIIRTTYSSANSPLVVRVAVIDPDAGALNLASTVGAAVGVKETTTAMLGTATEAYVGVNASYSVPNKGQKAPGEEISEDRSVPMVTSIQEDIVQGASCMKGQNAVVLQHGRPHFARITTALEIRSGEGTADPADDATRAVDGVNRYPGWIPFCQQGPDDDTFHTLRTPRARRSTSTSTAVRWTVVIPPSRMTARSSFSPLPTDTRRRCPATPTG